MAVFTNVTFGEAKNFLDLIGINGLLNLSNCPGGVDNTNYFADTEQGSFVLTLYERVDRSQLPYYLGLMRHLAQRGIPVPHPAKYSTVDSIHVLKGKPAAVFSKLFGESVPAPTGQHCIEVGKMLAQMHLAGHDYECTLNNPRDLSWCTKATQDLLPYLSKEQCALITSELLYQSSIRTTSSYCLLPRGPIHGDLFRDNVLFLDEKLTGILDFYFSGHDTLLLDLAICLNDWCVDHRSGIDDIQRMTALLSGYQSVRLLEASEHRLLNSMRRAAALRFWLSRLLDQFLPREATEIKPHDPAQFERMLRIGYQ
jgi:homoserine kinase type II